MNQMWNSKELLEHLKSPNFNHVTNIKSFDFFDPLYDYSSRLKLKNRFASIIWNSFSLKNGNCRYKYLVLGRKESYFVKKHSDSNASTQKMTSSRCSSFGHHFSSFKILCLAKDH